MNQRFRSFALWLIPMVILLLVTWQIFTSSNSIATKAPDASISSRNTAVSRMSYGRFIDYVDAGRVTAVQLEPSSVEYETLLMVGINELKVNAF